MTAHCNIVFYGLEYYLESHSKGLITAGLLIVGRIFLQ